jgi:hypothetical protein
MAGNDGPLNAFGSCGDSVTLGKNGKPFDLPPEHKPDQQVQPYVKPPTFQPLNHVGFPFTKELAAFRGPVKETQNESPASRDQSGLISNRLKPYFWGQKNW